MPTSALANRICVHANTALAGVKRLQRVGRWHMPTALPLARALAACIYGRSAVCTYHWPDRYRRIILAQVCALGQSACSVFNAVCELYQLKRCMWILPAQALLVLHGLVIGQNVFSISLWPKRCRHMLSAHTL